MIYYMLTDGNGSYIRKDEYSNKYVPIRNINFAVKWTQRNKAVNVLNSCLSKAVRSRFSIVEVEEKNSPCVVQEDINNKNEEAKCISEEIIPDDQTQKWSAKISDIKQVVQDAEQRKEELIQLLSEVDKEITDIHHYIEFGKFNAYQGWLAFSMLRNRLKRRRRIKDELTILTQLGECKICSSMLDNMEMAIDGLKNRKYTPRVLTTLFEQ